MTIFYTRLMTKPGIIVTQSGGMGSEVNVVSVSWRLGGKLNRLGHRACQELWVVLKWGLENKLYSSGLMGENVGQLTAARER
jgi:hypothetical protein